MIVSAMAPASRTRRLNEIGVDDGGESAGNRVNAGGDDENDRGGPLIPADDAFEHDGGGVEVHGNFREDVGDDRNSGEIRGAIAVEAALEKFGHGENVGAQIEGNEDPAEQKEDAGRLPLEISRRRVPTLRRSRRGR